MASSCGDRRPVGFSLAEITWSAGGWSEVKSIRARPTTIFGEIKLPSFLEAQRPSEALDRGAALSEVPCALRLRSVVVFAQRWRKTGLSSLALACNEYDRG